MARDPFGRAKPRRLRRVLLAAAAVVACLRQRDDGLWMQAGVHSVSATVDVGRALDTMRALGVTIDEQVLSV